MAVAPRTGISGAAGSGIDRSAPLPDRHIPARSGTAAPEIRFACGKAAGAGAVDRGGRSIERRGPWDPTHSLAHGAGDGTIVYHGHFARLCVMNNRQSSPMRGRACCLQAHDSVSPGRSALI